MNKVIPPRGVTGRKESAYDSSSLVPFHKTVDIIIMMVRALLLVLQWQR